jgi:8-oxo-dGTP pyrophosphatase MutT (NUDIX family)
MDINVKRRTAEAILIDGPDLLLIKRTRPSQAPYWVTIGGAVDPEDATLEDTLRREVLEEIGSQIKNVAQAFMIKDVIEDGIAIRRLFLAERTPGDPVDPTGKELNIPNRGKYELVRVPFTAEGLGRNRPQAGNPG